MDLPPDVSILHHDHNNIGGSVSFVVNNKMDSKEIAVDAPIEIIAVKLSMLLQMVILSVTLMRMY